MAEREKWISVTRVDCIHFGGKVELGDVKERDTRRERERIEEGKDDRKHMPTLEYDRVKGAGEFRGRRKQYKMLNKEKKRKQYKISLIKERKNDTPK